MGIRLSDLWRWDGTVDRGPYVLIGLVGFAIKHNLDRFVATFLFGRPWGLFNYWIPPVEAVRITLLPKQDATFLAFMLVMALPFIWIGVVLTLRRLRAVQLPTWLVAVFFLPVVNLAFFALLSVLPSRQELALEPPSGRSRLRAYFDRIIPDHPLGSAVMALGIVVFFGFGLALLGTHLISLYGLGLFIALPFCNGLASVLLYGYHRPRSYGSCLLVSIISAALLSWALLAVAAEGIVCLFMAVPIAYVLTIMGGSIGYVIQRRPGTGVEAPAGLVVLLAFVPILMGAESVSAPAPVRFEVQTAIEINAPPEAVWRRLASFPGLPEPTEWLFRLGVAYPMQATIRGHGVGGVRECLFSTGTFVEVIDAWEEARLLGFSVVSQPPPMRELSPYGDIHPPHLNGYFMPERGEFRLKGLSGGRTRLEGRSWYRNRMWPATYWQLWSDSIVHHIHLRVFRHVKQLAEQDYSSAAGR